MDAWTVLGAFKLFIDVVDGGPKAVAKGILMMGVPHGEVLDVGEVAFGLFGFDGGYRGRVVFHRDQQVAFASIQLVNRETVKKALADYDFPALAKRKFAAMDRKSLSSPKFPRLENRSFEDRRFPEL